MTLARHIGETMDRSPSSRNHGQRGQIIVIGALALVAMVGLGALVLEGGNAYAQQRVVQNGADAAANAGAVVIAQKLSGTTQNDAAVLAAVTTSATANNLTNVVGRYTDVMGHYLNSGGTVVSDPADAALVGGGSIPAKAQGVAIGGTRTFDTVLARSLGFASFDASADATAVAGALAGGAFLPVIFPVNITACEGNGNLGIGEEFWQLSQPGEPPVGPEYIVPLCKTGSGSFQILDLDPNLRCDDEIANIPVIHWTTFPLDVPSDNGNNCAKPIADYVNANLQGKVVLVPICDDECTTTGGSKAFYHVIKVAAFYVDYMSDDNKKRNPECEGRPGFIDMGGNGSSSCLAGWFVRYITAGPVGTGEVKNSDAIGIQLIK